MCVDDIRLEFPAQTDQRGEIAKEHEWVALLALVNLYAPDTIRVEKRIVMTSGTGIDDLMAFPRLFASQIDGHIDVPITMIAVLDQMENAH